MKAPRGNEALAWEPPLNTDVQVGGRKKKRRQEKYLKQKKAEVSPGKYTDAIV